MSFIAAAGLAQAADAAFLTGQVTNADALPLKAAEVHLFAIEDNYRASQRQLEGSRLDAVASARCDARGRFRLTVPAAGVYRVRVEAQGHLAAQYQPLPLALPLDADIELPAVALREASKTAIEFHRQSSSAPIGGAFVSVVSSKVGGGPALGRGSSAQGWRPISRSGRIGRDGVLVVPVARGEWLDLAIMPPWSDLPRRILGVEGVRYFLDPKPEASGVLVVQDGAGTPLAGVVALLGAEGIPIGMSGEDGRLEVRGNFTEPEPLQLFDATGRRFDGWWLTPPPGVEVVRELPDLERLAGRALSIRERTPIAGSLVWSNRDPGRFATTAADGQFSLALPRESGKLWIEGKAAGHLAAHFVGDRPSQWRGIRLDLIFEVAARLRGVVVDKAGLPLPGVDLQLDSDQPWPSFALDQAAGRAVTDADGHFEIAPLSGDVSYSLGASKLGFTTSHVKLEPAKLASPLRLVLDAQKAAFGRVVDVEERPVAGAVVRAVAADGRRRRLVDASTDDPFSGITDEAGRFELAALPSSLINLEAERQGFAPMTVRAVDVSRPTADTASPGTVGEVDASVDLGTLFMETGRSVFGVVVDEAGQPIEQASVWQVERISPSLRQQLMVLRDLEPDTASDVEGRFQLDDLPGTTRLELVVFRPGFRPTSVEGVEVGGGEVGSLEDVAEVEVVLSPASTVAGRVVDEAGDGIVGASVSLNPHIFETGSLEPTTLDGDDLQNTSTDSEGHFLFDVVTPGAYSAIASSNAHQPAMPIDIEIASEESLDDLDFVLEDGAVLNGFAQTEAGEPLRGVRVTAGDSYDMSDSQGRFRVLGITPGVHSVEGYYEGLPRVRKELDIALGESETELIFALGVEVEGRVADAGGAALGGVWVSMEGGDLFAEYSATTDSQGQFALEGVGPGEYRLRARRRGFADFDEAAALRLGDAAKRDVRIVLDDAGSITGQLTGLDFEDLERVVVSAGFGRREVMGEVDFEGRYRLEDLARGDWLVRAEVPGTGREAEARVPLAAGERANQNLDFANGFSLSGSVWWNGSALPATLIAVRGLDVALERQARSNHEGEFQIENLRPGRYRVDASNPRQLLTQNLDIDLDSDREISIEFDTARVSGRVFAQDDGRALGDAIVVLRRQLQETSEPGSMSSVGTRLDGGFEFARLTRGSYRLSVQRDGFVPHSEDVEVFDDVGPLELELSAASGLDLVVRRDDGSVPPHVFVSVLGPDGQPRHAEGRDLAADGSTRLPNLAAGNWRLWLSSPGAVPLQIDVEVPSEAPVAVELQRAGQVAVRVDSLVRSSAIATLTLIGPDGAAWRAFDVNTGTPQDAWRVSAGVAQVDGVPPGEWLVRVETPTGALWESTAATIGGRITQVTLE